MEEASPLKVLADGPSPKIFAATSRNKFHECFRLTRGKCRAIAHKLLVGTVTPTVPILVKRGKRGNE